MFRGFSGKSFREIISALLLRVDFEDRDVTICYVTPEEVPLEEEVLRPVGDLLLGCKKKASIDVFKDTAADGRLELRRQTESGDDFSQK